MELRELGHWRMLLTPLIVPLFYWGAIITAMLAGIFGLMGGLVFLSDNPVFGMMVIAFSICATCVVILTIRLVAEFFVISFQTNGHLNAIRSVLDRAEQVEARADRQQTHLSRAA